MAEDTSREATEDGGGRRIGQKATEDGRGEAMPKVYLVCLIGRVCLVDLVYLADLVYFVPRTKEAHKPDEPE